MTKVEALEFKSRWQLVNRFVAEEIRSTPPEIKLQQMRTVMATANYFPSLVDSNEETEEVRNRWRLLKDRLHA